MLNNKENDIISMRLFIIIFNFISGFPFFKMKKFLTSIIAIFYLFTSLGSHAASALLHGENRFLGV